MNINPHSSTCRSLRGVRATRSSTHFVILAALLLPLNILLAQEPATVQVKRDPRAPLSVSVDFGGGSTSQPAKTGDKFQRIGIYPRQVVDVAVQYAPANSGNGIVADALDGGRVIAQGRALEIDAKGLLTFRFQAGNAIGHSRVTLYDGEIVNTIEFWVIDRTHPENNPKLAGN